MKISLKLFLVNLFVVFVSFLINSALWSQNVAHDMTPAVVFLLVCVMFILNLTYFLGLKNDKNSLCFWPFVGCLFPSLIGVFGLGLQSLGTTDELYPIEFTVVVSNLVLGLLPFYILIQYQKKQQITN